MGKRIFLFIVTNIAVVLTLTIVLRILGVDRYVGPGGLNIGALAAFSLVWGMTGAIISLLISRWMAKMSTGMVIVDGHTGDPRSDRVYSMIAGLTQKAGLPMPEVGIYDSPEVNAFATGPSRSRALVAVSTGLLRSMNDDQVEGVLGHEVTHIANGDMVTMTLLQGIINAFVIFFSRLIAYVIANRGDSRERGSSGGSFFVVIALQIVLGLLGSLITACTHPTRCARRPCHQGIPGDRPWYAAATRRTDRTAPAPRSRRSPQGHRRSGRCSERDNVFRRRERRRVFVGELPARHRAHAPDSRTPCRNRMADCRRSDIRFT